MIGQRNEYMLLMQLMFLRQIPGFDVKMIKRYIRMGIANFQFVIWGGISSDIGSEIMFYSPTDA